MLYHGSLAKLLISKAFDARTYFESRCRERASNAEWMRETPRFRGEHAEWINESNNGFQHTRAARQYVAKIAAAGSWAAYEKAHTRDLVPVFEKVFPRPRLPHEIASHVVRFCFHTGL